jgi:tellurite resistance-related uncharacterized protein
MVMVGMKKVNLQVEVVSPQVWYKVLALTEDEKPSFSQLEH